MIELSDIRNLEASRETDDLIQWAIFAPYYRQPDYKLRLTEDGDFAWSELLGEFVRIALPHYSTDIDEAEKIIGKIKELDPAFIFYASMHNHGPWKITIHGALVTHSEAETKPLAICKAGLLYVYAWKTGARHAS